MPKLTQLLKPKNRDESQGKEETDTDYLARMVQDNATRQNFSALTFRFSYNLGLDLDTAYLARMIAGNAGDYTSLARYSELDLSAASVYMASHVRGVPTTLAEIVRLTGVSRDTIHTLNTELYLEQKCLSDADWRDIFGGSRSLTVVEIRRALSFPPFTSRVT